MNSSTLEDKINDLRPHYSEKYRSMIEAISNKGEKTGTGDVAQFGPIYQTFMYACVISVRLGQPKYLEPQEEKYEFAVMSKWKPTPIRDFIVMMMLNRSESFGYKWMDLENADENMVGNFIRSLEKEMEGYANAGFEYLYQKWEKERATFSSPTIFVEILQDLPNK